MKKFTLLFTALLCAVTSSVMAATYTIEFLTNTTDGSTEISNTTKTSTVVTQASEQYISAFTSNCSKAYYKGKSGVKLGSGSAAGTLEFTLAAAVQENIKKITVKSAQYSSDTGKLSLTADGTNLLNSFTPGKDTTYTFAAKTKVTTITLNTSSKRAYVSSIVVETEDAPVPATGISLDKSTLTLDKGATEQLTATLEPEGATTEVVWTTDNTAVATVANGLVTAVGVGSATITATAGEHTAACTVTVSAGVAVSDVTLDQSTLTLEATKTATLVATITPEDATNKTVSWTTSNDKVATVKDGVVTAVAAGTADITVTTEDGAKTAVCNVTVTNISGMNYSVNLGTAAGYNTWTIDNKSIGTLSSVWSLDATNGWAKASAYYNRKNNAAEAWLISPVLDLSEAEVATMTINHALNYLNGNACPLKIMGTKDGANWVELAISEWPAGTSWTFEDATVDLTSVISATTQVAFAYISTTTVAPTWEVKTVAIKGTQAVPATAIALDNTTLNLEQYKRGQLTATLTPTDATTPVVWTTSNEKVATVSATGEVMAVGVGSAKITATVTPAEGTSYTATCDVTVAAATPITVAKAAEIAKTVSADNEIAAGGMYVIRGYVTKIAYAYSSSSNNLSVWMDDEKGGSTTAFQAYKVIPVADKDQTVAVGDSVEVIADLTKYGTTYETAAGGSIRILTTYNITATVNDETMGTVAGAGNYDKNAEVTLTAKANDGYEFVNWTNAAEDTIGTAETLTFTATQDSTIKANFKAEVPLTPATWYGEKPLTGTITGTTKEYSIVYEITRNADKTLTMKYTINDEDLTGLNFLVRNLVIADEPTETAYLGKFESNTEGGYSVTTTRKFKDGEVLSLKMYFAVRGSSAPTNTYTDVFEYTVGSSNSKPTATYTITATVNDETMGTVTGAGDYEEGVEVTLTAKANDGYEFVNWTNAANETIGTETTLTFTATQDSTIKANFKATELTPATWYGQEPLTGTLSDVNYSLVYEITRNATRTLTFKLALNDEAAAVEGLKISIAINNNIVGTIDENFTSGTFTTSGYYTDGDELNIQFYLGYTSPGVYTSTIKYIVGSSNNKPTAIDSVSAEAKATKRIVNGVLVIEKNGVRYNAQGVVIE